jgi:pSer/pThr/pTyr-binding forkhead associated (FHA) protein
MSHQFTFSNFGKLPILAKILWNVEKKEVSITDLGSSNGTFIDGVRIPSNQPIPIKNGVLVRFAANLSVVISFIRN